MSTCLDLANAQVSLDRDRENVEATARKLYTYCAALRERIRRYYGCMATAEKWAELMEQAQRCAGLMPILADFIEYMQNEEAWVSIQHPPSTAHRLSWPKLPDVVGAMSEMNDLIQKGGKNA